MALLAKKVPDPCRRSIFRKRQAALHTQIYSNTTKDSAKALAVDNTGANDTVSFCLNFSKKSEHTHTYVFLYSDYIIEPFRTIIDEYTVDQRR